MTDPFPSAHSPAPPLQLHRQLSDLAAIPGPLVLAIGVFDGLHLGHRAVVGRAIQAANECEGTAVMVTFDPHPATLLRPASAPRLLANTAHKIQLAAEIGIHHLLLIHFDATFCKTPAADFANALTAHAKPLHAIVVGEDWRFGCDRRGDLHLLQTLGRQHHFRAIGVPPVQVDGQTISSTRIRQCIASGDLDAAERLLGRRFSVLGTVIQGDQLGRTIGFPTANLRVGGEQFPPDGVYATAARYDGHWHPSVTNLGWRPTIRSAAARERLLETHLLDGHHHLYNRTMEVRFDARLRNERTFPSLDALKAQIAQDAATAAAHFHQRTNADPVAATIPAFPLTPH